MPRKLPKNRRTRRWPDSIKLLGVEMNILENLFDWGEKVKASELFQMCCSPRHLGSGWYACYSRKCNQRRHRNQMRRSVFANRRIARGF